jgi:hypothetical protein
MLKANGIAPRTGQSGGLVAPVDSSNNNSNNASSATQVTCPFCNGSFSDIALHMDSCSIISGN